MALPAGRRHVLVLAPDPSADVREHVRRAKEERAELVVVSVVDPGTLPQQAEEGPDAVVAIPRDPTTPLQRQLTNEAMRVGAEVGVSVEARLLMTLEGARELCQNARAVHVAAARNSDRRGLEAALKPKRPAIRGVATWDPESDASASTGTHPQEAERVAVAGSESVEALSGKRVATPRMRSYWTPQIAKAEKKAAFRIYFGAAPGVGKTYAMLGEGQRRRNRGTDVVVAYAETYSRPLTAEMLTGLEFVPRQRLSYRGTSFDELDADAVIARRPDVALVDELAHTNIPGARRAKRWEDVLDILAAGIEVITTVNVQHLESMNDVVATITGIRQQETVPDWVADLADQVELVDMSPEALQKRMRHGNVYPDPRKADLALRRFFTLENLTALRELALMRVANRVDAQLLEHWSKPSTPETRERILVCISHPELSEDLVRRGARMAQRAGGELVVLHVRDHDSAAKSASLKNLETLTNDLGGQFHVIEAESVVEGILSFAYEHHVTQCVVGESDRSSWQEWLHGSVVNKLIREASQIDIHVIARRQRA